MRSMTRMAVAGCMALAALSAVAVLDVGSTTADAAPSVSPFAGTYDWSSYDRWFYWYWPAPITISDAGEITSSYFSGGGDEWSKGSISGRVSADGRYSFTVSSNGYTYHPRGSERWKSSFRSAGNMASDAAGNIVGTEGTGASFVWLRQ